ncbi:protein TonB [Pontibacter aydingkolensis]|uniref:TonB family protein n=1 Tax=Pontibacter aydingkolensis TaxID=1911536 RepID=A0ABS7CQZ7_9BACT|nr:energy transducer TonB [Pontibacter aydingkolensis]MBW7466281.1 TonB family protein [Pontibacter aydingkolensis]
MKTLYAYLFTALILFVYNMATAQGKINFVDKYSRSVPAPEALYFEEVIENPDGSGSRTRYLMADSSKVSQHTYSNLKGGEHKTGILDGPHTEWHRSGTLKTQQNYSNGDLSGISQVWYESGKLCLSEKYVKGELQDTLIAYFETGTVRRREIYNKGEMVSGKVYNESGQEKAYFPRYQFPVFPGGEDAMLRHLSSNIKYPKATRKAKVQGLVVIVFDVDTNGNLGEHTVLKNLHPDADAEALRVIKTMPVWKPGLLEGEPVPVRYTLPIRFTIN